MPGQDAQFIATPLTTIAGMGDKTLAKFERLGIHNLYDLILNLPFRYEDRTYIRSVNTNPEDNVPCALLLTITGEPRIKTKITEIPAQDHEGTFIKLSFFKISPNYLRLLDIGTTVLAWGTVHKTYFGHTRYVSIMHPELHFISTNEIEMPSRLSPVYHLTAGLPQNKMRQFEQVALDVLARHPLEEYLPLTVNPYHIDLTQAIIETHNPEPRPDHGIVLKEALPSFQRICFEEIVAYKLSIMELRARQSSKEAPALTLDEAAQQRLIASLPFTPTEAQLRVFAEIMADCTTTHAMNRLVHGDVGSGKTLVAAMAILQFAQNGLQAALLAPTELLAKQHHKKLSELFAPLGIEVGLVLGTLKKNERQHIITAAADGAIKVFVGTHALYQDAMCYQNLSLVIVDEQHRFGVAQREALLHKAPPDKSAHELLMTATPIPRSLQLALTSDCDVSTIDMMPKGRSPITTTMVSLNRVGRIIERLRAHCSQGNQAYWVCPLIDDTELIETGSVKKRFQELEQALPELTIGLLHAQMSEKAKNETMERFVAGEIQILVATTIVEVGVDVPNATVIVIESADRMGLAQLHQLRGRVGRGTKPSFCLMLYQDQEVLDPIAQERKERAHQRLEVMRRTTNGFEIANQDLLMRGAGEIFGAQQAGKENFRFADLNRDYDLMAGAQQAAQSIFQNDPQCTRNLILRWFPEVLNPENGPSSPHATVSA